MKRLIFALFIFICLTACSVSDDNEVILYELVPVTEVDIPETLVQGETYTFTITYMRPSNCHAFAGFDYNRDVNERVIGVVNYYFQNNSGCTEEAILTEAPLEFYVERNDFYIFKFWQGNDEEGEPQFLTIEVPVEVDSTD